MAFNSLDMVRDGGVGLAPLAWRMKDGRKDLEYSLGGGFYQDIWHKTHEFSLSSDRLGYRTTKSTEALVSEDALPGDCSRTAFISVIKQILADLYAGMPLQGDSRCTVIQSSVQALSQT